MVMEKRNERETERDDNALPIQTKLSSGQAYKRLRGEGENKSTQ
jgi:hypothetical protein